MSRASLPLLKLIVAALVGASGIVCAAPLAASAAPPDPCHRALAYEKAATQDSASAQARYDSAVAGLTANQMCTDPQMKLVNEAYLLSMRAPAEHDLHIGNWQRDLTRANDLLTQCSNWPGLRGTRAGTDCATQRTYNGIIAKNLASQPTPSPTAAPPAAPANASPAPAASGGPAPRLGPAMPPPAPPSPSPAPHH